MADFVPAHAITSPQDGKDVTAFQHNGQWFINAAGGQSNGPPYPRILKVYGMVFATPAKATACLNPPATATPGSHARDVNGIEQYSFTDGSPNYNSIPVNAIDDDANFLQVWVQFEFGAAPFTLATAPIQFDPTS